MRNTAIFTLMYPKGTERFYEASNGFKGSHVCQHDLGYISGVGTSIPAAMLIGVTEHDQWFLVNLCNSEHVFLGNAAVLGATSPEHAAHVALSSFNGDFGGIAQVFDVIEVPTFVLSRLLDDESRADYGGRIKVEELNRLKDKLTSTPVHWSDGNVLTSHIDVPHLVNEMVRHDATGEMQAAVDDLNTYLQDAMIGAEVGQYDAVTIPVSRFDSLTSRMLSNIEKATKDVKAVGAEKVGPFTKNGVVNLAQAFNFSDGQAFRIIYHNPDATPAKLDADDILTSWKFTLNKRDVTAVVQPKSGKNVDFTDLAKRIVALVEANSARFVRAQKRAAIQQQELLELEKLEQEKLERIKDLDVEIEALQAQLDQTMQNAVETAKAKMDGFNVDDDGDILSSKGKTFLTLALPSRMLAEHDLKGYLPKWKDNGLVISKLNNEQYRVKGYITAGHPDHTEVLNKATPKGMFDLFGRTFVVAEVMGSIQKERFEVIEMQSRLSVNIIGADGENVWGFSSANDAYKQAKARLMAMGEDGFKNTSLYRTESPDFAKSERIVDGEELQPFKQKEQQVKLEAEQQVKDSLIELDQYRDASGKLDPLSVLPRVRVQALKEMTVSERLAFIPTWQEYLNKQLPEDRRAGADDMNAKIKAAKHSYLASLTLGQLSEDDKKLVLTEKLNNEIEIMAYVAKDSSEYAVASERANALKGQLLEMGVTVAEDQNQGNAVSIYDIASTNPRKKRPDGRLTIKTASDGVYDAKLHLNSIGAEFSGPIMIIREWVKNRLTTPSKALAGLTTDWSEIADRLQLKEGEDILVTGYQREHEQVRAARREKIAQSRANAAFVDEISSEDYAALSNEFFAGLPEKDGKQNLISKLMLPKDEIREQAIKTLEKIKNHLAELHKNVVDNTAEGNSSDLDYRAKVKALEDQLKEIADGDKISGIKVGGQTYNSSQSAMLGIALNAAENGIKPEDAAFSLQMALNSASKLRQNVIKMPKNDNVTKGKTKNKVRRLNKAFSDANVPIKVDQSDDDVVVMGVENAIQQYPRIVFTYYSVGNEFYVSGQHKNASKQYGELTNAILAYLNEDKAIDGSTVLFGVDGNFIDTATRQLKDDVKALFNDIEPAPEQGVINLDDEKDNAWLDQIVSGEVDAATVNMTELKNLVQKHGENQESEIYEKLSNVLNIVAQAKLAKAKSAA